MQYSSGIFSGDGCSVVSAGNVWSIQANPAMIAFNEQSIAGVAYCTNFDITNMICTRINACTSIKHLGLGSTLLYYGNQHYHNGTLGFCLSRKINQRNALSITFDANKCYNELYKSTLNIYPELAYYGTQDNLSYGLHIINPFGILGTKKDSESIFKIGCNYQINKLFSFASSVQYNSNTGTTFSIATRYNYKDKIVSCLSYQNSQNPIALSFQLPVGNLTCYYETILNLYLGLSHTIMFSFTL